MLARGVWIKVLRKNFKVFQPFEALYWITVKRGVRFGLRVFPCSKNESDMLYPPLRPDKPTGKKPKISRFGAREGLQPELGPKMTLGATCQGGFLDDLG